MSYDQSEADRYSNNLDTIVRNGGLGSFEYHNTQGQMNAHQAAADWENRSKTPLFPQSDTFNLGSTPSGYNAYQYSGAGRNPNKKYASAGGKWMFFLSLVLGPLLGFLLLLTNLVEVPSSVPMFTQSSVSTKGSFPDVVKMIADQNVNSLKVEYANIFKPSTPFEKMIGPCKMSKLTCLDFSYEGFLRLKPYAINQETYWNDVCNISSKPLRNSIDLGFVVPALFGLAFLRPEWFDFKFVKPELFQFESVKSEWFLAASKNRSNKNSHTCILQNRDQIDQANHKAFDKYSKLGGLVAFLIVLFGFSVMMSSRKKPGEIKSSKNKK
jgi:hypothetical protein